jgi:hypothetical protein
LELPRRYGIREAVGDSIAVRLEGDLFLELGQVVLKRGTFLTK